MGKLINDYMHIKRYRKIIMVFIKHEFGLIMEQMGILKYLNINKNLLKKTEQNEPPKRSTGQRLRLALEELGTSFIKIGQILSTRTDIFSQEIIHELEKLQNNVPPFSYESVESIIENEFDERIDSLFLEFSRTPLAAGSIAQVHLAKLKNGDQVVVKVQRPGIIDTINQDIKILEDLASFLDNHTKLGKLYEFKHMVEEFRNVLNNELDFSIEAQNAGIFKENFHNQNKDVTVPNIRWTHTTKHVLTMEFIDGIHVQDIDRIEEIYIDKKKLAKTIATSILNQILKDGFFHADPHPGNIMLSTTDKIVFIDLGMVGTLNKDRKSQLMKMLLGLVFNNTKLIVSALCEYGYMTDWSNMKKLETDVDSLRSKYMSMPLNKIKLGKAFSELFNIAFSHHIKIPKEFTILSKTLITMEGTVERLDPELSILEVAQPLAKKLLFDEDQIKKLGKEFFESAVDYGRLLKELPSFLHNFLRKLEFEDFTFYFELKNTESTLKHIDKIFNRISFGIALLALSIIIAGIIIGTSLALDASSDMYIFNTSVLKITLLSATVMVIWLLVSIFRSNKF